MSVEQYRKRFFNLMESTMGDVRPLIKESPSNEILNGEIKYPLKTYNGEYYVSSDGEKIPNGKGIMKYKDGGVENGEFKDGEFLDPDPKSVERKKIYSDKSTHKYTSREYDPSKGISAICGGSEYDECQKWLNSNPEGLSSGKVKLRRGRRGGCVKYIQCLLNDFKDDELINDLPYTNLDGIFGPKTEALLKRYQTSAGLTPDGVLGPKTANSDLFDNFGW